MSATRAAKEIPNAAATREPSKFHSSGPAVILPPGLAPRGGSHAVASAREDLELAGRLVAAVAGKEP